MRPSFAAALLAFVVALGTSSCGGTLVDHDGMELAGIEDGGASGTDAARSGLFCARDDECLCEPCQSTDECLAGLSCVEAKHKGEPCGRRICIVHDGDDD